MHSRLSISENGELLVHTNIFDLGQFLFCLAACTESTNLVGLRNFQWKLHSGRLAYRIQDIGKAFSTFHRIQREPLRQSEIPPEHTHTNMSHQIFYWCRNLLIKIKTFEAINVYLYLMCISNGNVNRIPIIVGTYHISIRFRPSSANTTVSNRSISKVSPFFLVCYAVCINK